MSDFLYEVGDEFEGGPIELQKYIHAILSVGGEFKYEGDTVTIVALPGKEAKVASEFPHPVEEVVIPAPEPVIEEPIVEEAPEPVVEEPAPVEEAPAPKPKGRPRKTTVKETPAESEEG